MSLVFIPKGTPTPKRTLNKTPVGRSELYKFIHLRALNVTYQQIASLLGRSTVIWSLAAERYGVTQQIKDERAALINNRLEL